MNEFLPAERLGPIARMSEIEKEAISRL
ncbi:hypothetical protein LCGC14_2418540, partial [marine sediment metagenome]